MTRPIASAFRGRVGEKKDKLLHTILDWLEGGIGRCIFVNVSMPYVLQPDAAKRCVCVASCVLILDSLKQQHADERSETEKAHADGQSVSRALVA